MEQFVEWRKVEVEVKIRVAKARVLVGRLTHLNIRRLTHLNSVRRRMTHIYDGVFETVKTHNKSNVNVKTRH